MSQRLSGIGMTSQRTRTRLIQRLRDQGIREERVLEAMRSVPRHLFVDEALASRAYEDNSLPIGHGQTISHPFTVARMTECLCQGPMPLNVLEVGTGSGYQTAILATLFPRIYTVERIDGLFRTARRRLAELQLHNIDFKLSDGSWGWPEHAPYDAIIVTAAPAEVPGALLDQLAPDGRLIMPLGREQQELVLLTPKGSGFHTERLGLAHFVPLVKDRH